ncbi:MAG TPA: diguanylate cyclase [Pyrinomonadaceae bacterium]|nr:diguanylate cyclase [Pyrinomonadaceae bacterium]
MPTDILDLRTLSFVMMLAMIVSSLIMSFVTLTQRTYPGFGLWTIGNLLASVGFFLLGLRGAIPDFFSILVGNACVFIHLIFSLEGIRRFVGLTQTRYFDIAMVVLLLGPLTYFTYIDNSIYSRIFVISVLSAIVAGRGGYELYRKIERDVRFGYGLMIVLYFSFAAFMLIRAGLTYRFSDFSSVNDFFRPDWIQSVSFMGLILFVLGWTFGFVVLNSQRIESDLKQAQQSLEELAATDFLTGLHNRRNFFRLAENEIKHASRFRHNLSLIAFDVDHFKAVNDTFGHPAGDKLLIAISELFKDRLRTTDILGRLGGEEFVALLPYTDLEQAKTLAEYLRTTIEANSIESENGTIKVTASFGVTELTGVDPDVATLLERADKLLYGAKRSGRNQINF